MTGLVIAALVLLVVLVVVFWLRTDPAEYTRDPLIADHVRTLRVHRLEPVDGCPLCDAAKADELVIDFRQVGPATTSTSGVGYPVEPRFVPLYKGPVSVPSAVVPMEPTAAEIAQAEQDIHDAFHIDRGSQA